MILPIKRVNNFPPHLSYVSTLPDITQNRNTFTLGTVLRGSSTKPVANMAACMCKGKGTSLQTPAVI